MSTMRAAALLTLCAALAACGNGTGADDPPAAAAAEVAATPSADRSGFVDVPYPLYAEAAFQTGISPSAIVREAGFSEGLADLCDNSPAEFAALVELMRAETASEDDPVNRLKARFAEVDLRVDLACRDRMTDWLYARGGLEDVEEPYASVTPGADGTDSGTSSVHVAPGGSEYTGDAYDPAESYTTEPGTPEPGADASGPGGAGGAGGAGGTGSTSETQ